MPTRSAPTRPVPPCTRRQFLAGTAPATCGVLLAAVLAPLRRLSARESARAHPTPRPGITAARVATAAELRDVPALIPLFDAVRAMPQVADGIGCHCGCATLPGYYSLLSCYEGEAMARQCTICQGQARLAARLHAAGRSLDQIRVAVDAKFG